MKLHITYDFSDLSHALKTAEQTAGVADIIGIGSLLIFKEGVKAVQSFKSAFPNKPLFVEIKISEKADEAVALMANAGANYITVLAGASVHTIKKAVDAAKNFDVKIALDLLSAPSLGQSAHDAKTLGAQLLVLHRCPGLDHENELEAEFREVRDNTQLPIFITGKIDESNIEKIKELNPQGVMIGASITKADNPSKAAHYFKTIVGE